MHSAASVAQRPTSSTSHASAPSSSAGGLLHLHCPHRGLVSLASSPRHATTRARTHASAGSAGGSQAKAASVHPTSSASASKPKVTLATPPSTAPGMGGPSMGGAAMSELDKLRMSSVNRYASERKSSIIAVGLTVHTAPVEVREKLAVPEDRWADAVRDLCASPHVEEACILSTCNRMELYSVGLSWHRGVREVQEWLAKYSGLPIEELRPHLFLLRDRDAIRHLLRVSGGLDSLVMGEGQILAQVKNAHRLGTELASMDVPADAPPSNGFGRHMNALFKQAIQAGKRVRAETDIASVAVSVSSAAAELCQLKLPQRSFEGVKVLIVGAGKMSRLLVKHLHSKGCNAVCVVNRSMPRCEALAEEFPNVKFEFALSDQLLAKCAQADVVFAASSSDCVLIGAEEAEGLGAPPGASEATGGIRRFFDISVPRNIDTKAISALEGSAAFSVDDLREVVDANKSARAAAAMAAEVLLVEELHGYEAWRDSLETVPTIKKLRSKADAIRKGELDKAVNKMGEGLSKKERRVLEDLSKGIVNKLLHGPMQALRCDGSDPESVGESLANMHALENMFELASDPEEEAMKIMAQRNQGSKTKGRK